MTRVESVYAAFGASERPVKKFRSAILYAGLVTVPALLIVAVLLSRAAHAITLDDVSVALADVQYLRTEMSFVSFDQSTEHLIKVSWYSGMKSKTKYVSSAPEPFRETGFDGTHEWAINYRERKAWTKELELIPKRHKDRWSLNSRLRSWGVGSSESLAVESWGNDTTAFFAFDYVHFQNVEGREMRIEISVDRKTSLPIMERQFNPNSKGGWFLVAITRYFYPKHIDDSIFDFEIPAGFEILDRK